MNTIQIVSARQSVSSEEAFETHCILEIEAVPGLCNPIGRMHGGAVSLLADMSTTMATAPISNKDFWEFGGVTRTLNVTFLQPIPRGAVLLADCKLISIGKRSCECSPSSNSGHLAETDLSLVSCNTMYDQR